MKTTQEEADLEWIRSMYPIHTMLELGNKRPETIDGILNVPKEMGDLFGNKKRYKVVGHFKLVSPIRGHHYAIRLDTQNDLGWDMVVLVDWVNKIIPVLEKPEQDISWGMAAGAPVLALLGLAAGKKLFSKKKSIHAIKQIEKRQEQKVSR